MMYGTKNQVQLIGFTSKPIDKHHQRKKIITWTFQGELDSQLFGDVDESIQGYAEDVNESKVSSIVFPIPGIYVDLSVEAHGESENMSRDFKNAQLVQMSFRCPGKKETVGSYKLLVEIERDRDDGIFILDTERMRADVFLTKLKTTTNQQQGKLELDKPKKATKKASKAKKLKAEDAKAGEIVDPDPFDAK